MYTVHSQSFSYILLVQFSRHVHLIYLFLLDILSHLRFVLIWTHVIRNCLWVNRSSRATAPFSNALTNFLLQIKGIPLHDSMFLTYSFLILNKSKSIMSLWPLYFLIMIPWKSQSNSESSHYHIVRFCYLYLCRSIR